MPDTPFETKCPSCGKELKEEYKYCPYCGADIGIPAVGAEATKTSRELFESAQINYDNDINLEQALANCEMSIKYDPNFAEAHNLRGLILDELGENKKAISAYRKALKLNPMLEDARANLADAEAELGSIDLEETESEVEETFQKAAEDTSVPAEDSLQKAQRLYDLDTNLEEALSAVNLSLEQNPNSAEAVNLRGLILDELGRTDEAIASYREALKIDPAF